MSILFNVRFHLDFNRLFNESLRLFEYVIYNLLFHTYCISAQSQLPATMIGDIEKPNRFTDFPNLFSKCGSFRKVGG